MHLGLLIFKLIFQKEPDLLGRVFSSVTKPVISYIVFPGHSVRLIHRVTLKKKIDLLGQSVGHPFIRVDAQYPIIGSL